jgi:hypothetical protein
MLTHADNLRSSIKNTLSTQSQSKLKSNHQATPLPNTNVHMCTGVAEGGKPNIREDIYYVGEFKSLKDDVTRYLSRGVSVLSPDPNLFLVFRRISLNAGIFTPNSPLQEFDTDDRTQQRIHFRFKLNPVNRRYSMINGQSGQYIYAVMDSQNAFDPAFGDYMLVTHPTEDGEFTPSVCGADGTVTLTTLSFTVNRGGRARRGGYVRENPYNWQFSANAEAQAEVFFTDCCESCPPGSVFMYERTMQCGFCDDESCKKPAAMPDYQFMPTKFTFYENIDYIAADTPSGAVQNTETDPAAKYIAIIGVVAKTGLQIMSNKISYGSWVNVAGKIVNQFGKLATVASVGLGVIGFALSFVFDSMQPTIDDKLKALEDKIMDSVKTLVSDTVVGFAVNQALNTFSTARFKLNTEVRTAKRNNFISNNLDAINDDAIKVGFIASDINEGLDTIKPSGIVEPFNGDRSSVTNSPTIPDTPVNVKLIQQGYTLYVSSLMDMIAALSEAVMLKAYANPSMTCSEIMGSFGIAEHVDRQGFFLEQMQQFLQLRRESAVKLVDIPSNNYGSGTLYSVQDLLTSEDLYLSRQSNDANLNLVMEARRAELKFDMVNYGYRLSTVKQSLHELVLTTETLCGKLRTDSTFRNEYVACAKSSAGEGGVGC